VDYLYSFNLKRLVLSAKRAKLKLHILLALFFSQLLYADSIGSLLFHGNCITCHFETETVSAPAIVDVQRHYKSAFAKKEDFVKYMSQYVIKPKKELSIMQQAIDKHGIMPELGYEMEVAREIAEYIYDTDFNRPHSGH